MKPGTPTARGGWGSAISTAFARPKTLCFDIEPSSLLPIHGASITLDWNAVTWTSGQLTQSFDIDPGNPGNDVTITISGDTQRHSLPVTGTTLITGGVSPANKTLQLVTNFLTNLESIVVKIGFNYLNGVSGVNSVLHDIDGDGTTWREEVRGIFATNGAPPNLAPTQVLALNATPTFQTTGSASVSFGNLTTISTSFRFGASTTGSFDPIDSGISLGTVNYTTPPVPEPTSALRLFSAATLAGFARRRAKVNRQ